MALRLCLLVATAAAVREETRVVESVVDGNLADQEMKLVPAPILVAIRHSQKLAQEAEVKAAEHKQNVSAVEKEQEKKAEEANAKSDAASTAFTAAEEKRKTADAKRDAAEQALAASGQASEELVAAEKKQKELEDAKRKDDEEAVTKSAEFKKEMKRLMTENHLAQKKAEASGEALKKQEDLVKKAQAHEVAQGKLKAQKAMEAEEAEKEAQEADDKASEAQKEKDEALAVLTKAEAFSNLAKKKLLDAESDLEEKKALITLVKEVKTGVQHFYDAMNVASKSMETAFEQSQKEKEEGKAAKAMPELMLESKDVKEAYVAYNEMVMTFHRLNVKSPTFYAMAAEAVTEIHKNRDETIKYLCDPDMELQEHAKKANDPHMFEKKCGTGIWEGLGVPPIEFPTASHPPVEVAPHAKPAHKEEAHKEEPATAAAPEAEAER